MPTVSLRIPAALSPDRDRASWLWLAARSAVLVALYYVVALWGFVFTPDPHGIPLVWPATGVGLAMVYLYGPRLLPALALASGLVTWQFTSAMMPLLEAFGTIAATVVGVGLGAHFLRRLGFSAGFGRVRDVWLLLLVGGLAGSGLAATAGAWGVAVGVAELRFSDTWWLCWMADLMGLMLIAPVLITWLGSPFVRPAEHHVGKGVALIIAVLAVALVVYSGRLGPELAMPLSYAVFPLVMLAALRCPVQTTTGMVLAAGGIALSGTGWGLGPFAEMGMEKTLLSLNAQIALLVLTGLVLTALRGEREEAEARARRHLEELARAGRLSTLAELSAGLAHEINQPLCALASSAQASRRLLERGRLDDLREALTHMDTSAHRAAETVRQMRAFAAGQAPQRHPVTLGELLNPVLDLLRPELRRRNLRLEVSVPPDLPRLLAAPVQIEQVLVNLLRNAMEATDSSPEAGLIQVTAERAGPQVAITVSDNGPGIPKYRLAGLFDPFATWKEGGMGLGLSISRSLVEAHGGSIAARNRDSGGAEFRFTLPALEEKS